MSHQRLNARHFEIFLSLMTSRNLADAADKLSVSQPAISKTIRLLESEVGVPLFARVKGRLQPTPEAHQLLPHVQRAVGQLEFAKQVAYGLNSVSSGQVAIAVGAPVLPAIAAGVRRFQTEHPKFRLDIRTEITANILELVSNHEVEFGISASPLQNTDARVVQKCRSQLISENEMVVVLPKGHRLASRASIRPSDLGEEFIVALPNDTSNMLHVRAAFQQAQAPLNIRATVGNSIGVCALVREQMGVGFINPLQIVDGLFSDLVARPFRPRVVLQTLVYFSQFQPLSLPASALAECLIESLQQTTAELVNSLDRSRARTTEAARNRQHGRSNWLRS